MSKKETTKLFSMSYDEVNTKAQSVQPQYMSDVNEFNAFDPELTPELGAELETETQTALSDFSGESHKAEIERLTEAIAQQLEQGAKAYQRLIYYVEKAFGDSKAIGSTFGHPQYAKAVQSEKEMIPMLKQACAAANLDQFRPGLEEKGMPATLVPEIETLANKLATTDSQQELLKKQQLLVTSARITLYNSIWTKLSKISTVSKIIFANDPARLAIYQLYDSAPQTDTSDDSDTPSSPTTPTN